MTEDQPQRPASAYVRVACVLIFAGLALAFAYFCVPYVDPVLSSEHILAGRHLGNMMQLAQGIDMYMQDHEEQMPAELDALLDGEYVNGPDLFLRYPTDKRIVYRRLDKPSVGDVICWEPEPHVNQHKWLIFLTREHRYVVRYGRSHIDDMREDEFQELGLQGK